MKGRGNGRCRFTFEVIGVGEEVSWKRGLANALYFAYLSMPQPVFRATCISYFFFSNLCSLAALWMTGVYLGDAAGDFVYLLPGLACGIAWDTRYIRFAPSGDTGISHFPVILCAVRNRLCEKDYTISLNLLQMGIRKQRYMTILCWSWSSWVCSFRYYYGGVHESSWWRGESG